MRKGIFGFFIFVTTVAGATAARGEAPRGESVRLEIEPMGGLRPHVAVLPQMNAFAALDANCDGWLVKAELDDDFCAQFPIVDRDGDGRLSPIEYELHAERRSLMADIIKALMTRWDEDMDGLLSRAEFQGRPASFVEADQDENNLLHHEELMRLVGSARTFQYDPQLFFEAHDLDSDGAVVIDEWTKVEPDTALFQFIDGDGNGVIMPRETFYFLYHYERRLAMAEGAGEYVYIPRDAPGK